jgi:hypothetical protein
LTSKTSSEFWRLFEALPPQVQRQARKQYQLFRANPAHPSLRFKELHPDLMSVRINRDYRALGLRRGDVIAWFWIGSHADYDRMIC